MIEYRDSRGGILVNLGARGERAGRTGAVGKQLLPNAAAVKDISHAGDRPELIGFHVGMVIAVSPGCRSASPG
jgi:hypothetical protein